MRERSDVLLATAREAARVAASVHEAAIGDGNGRWVNEKTMSSDFVSDVDMRAQEAALEVIVTRHPRHHILAEEEGGGRPGAEEGESHGFSDRWPVTCYLYPYLLLQVLLCVMAGDPVLCGSTQIAESGIILQADFGGIDAPWMKMAAGWRIGRIGHIAFQDDRFAGHLHLRVVDRDSRHQGLGLGMQ